MPAAHCVSTLEGTILQVDQGFLDLLRRPESEIIGVSYKEITDPRDLGRSAAMLSLLEEGAAPVRLQKRYLRPDGSSIAANLLVTRFSDPDRLISTLFWQETGRDLPPARLWAAALRIRHVHEARMRLFGSELSTDPVGSLLIGVYLAEAEGRNIELEEVAVFAGVTPSTAARWAEALRQRGVLGLLSLGRYLQLTQSGLDRVEAMLTAVYDVPGAAAMLD